MPINTDLLIAAPILQDTFVDKDGTPMAGGIVTCYHDNSRTTLKNWYYQSGNPGNYTYITLPNPLTLSAAGTIADINGVDTIPFFYPYSEINDTVKDPYYITIVNHAQTNQITRANFPFLPPSNNNPNAVNSFNNLIINNGFWRNIQPNTLNITPFTSVNLTGVTSMTVAPSQHDGFRTPDIVFMQNSNSAAESLTFTPFPLSNTQPIQNYIVPEYYINHVSNADSMSGQTQKLYQFPISLHVNTLANVTFTVSIQAQNTGGTGIGQNVISLFILQDTGTGTSSPAPIPIGQITLNSSWETYTFTSVFPQTSGLTLGLGADDALYLQVQMPLNTSCSINFTKPSIYLTEDIVANNDFQTYDQVDAVINSPRTGDMRTSVNAFYPYGWVPMNDGLIALNNTNNLPPTTATPGYVRANADTWQLFNLLWNLAKPFDSGANFNPICQMYLNNGGAVVATNFGSSAYADFTASSPSKALQLTLMFGKTLMGTVPMSALMEFYAPQSQGVMATASGPNPDLLLTPTSITPFWQGAPVMFNQFSGSLPGNIASNFVYYVCNISAGAFKVATTYANAIAGTPVVPFSSPGSNVFVNFDPTGSSTGEYSHTPHLNELVPHTHNLTGQTGTILNTNAGAGGVSLLTNAGGATVTQASSGPGSPFNITQPGIFYNLFMKL